MPFLKGDKVMHIETKCFGNIELDDEKIITFNDGIMGFEDYKRYTILFDIDAGETPVISWLQCVEEKELAIPVINPFSVKPDYNPVVEDELIKPLGELNEDNLVILIALTVPADLKQMSANLKAPFVINSDTRKGCQLIAENQDYPIKYNVYDAIQQLKKQKGGA